MAEESAANDQRKERQQGPVKETVAAPSAAKPGGAAEQAEEAGIATFGQDIEIYCDKPLPQYNVNRNKAYRATSKAKVSGNLFAIVCERYFIPRRRAAAAYSSIINPCLPGLVGYGKVYWPLAGQERYVFIYRDVLGQPIVGKNDKTALGWKQERVMDVIVTPMVNILQDFRDKDFVHGSIRPDNMFNGGVSNDKLTKVYLGDCLSTPASYTQPSLYETIERSMADPIGRGPGTLTDDLYSFGVSLAVFLRSQNPLEGMDDEQVIREKIKLGSYAAITGKDRFRGSILELLRGLLHDDPTQRWNIDEVLVWMDGRRLSPKQALKKKTAARPYTYCGEKYLQAPLLAMALDIIPSETVKIIEDESLEQWLARSLEDENAVERVQEAQRAAHDAGRGSSSYPDLLVANLSSALDTVAPIRFKGLRLMGDGIGNALHEVVVLKQDINPFVDIIMQSVAMNWVTASENPNIDKTGLITRFDSCRSYLRQKKVGYGIERCVYTLAPEAPCLSPKLNEYYVTSPEDMMFAFEDLCRKGKDPAFFLDRHSIAFLSVNEPKSIDSYLYDLNVGDENKRMLANLKCMATIQKRYKMGNFPHICKVFLKAGSVLVKRYHDKQVRDKLMGNLEKYAKAGELGKMAALLDSAELTDRDMHAFAGAMREYRDLESEYKNLSEKLGDEKTFGLTTGRDISAIVSSVLAIIIIIVTVFMFLADKGGL